jgi:hypothetical protein
LPAANASASPGPLEHLFVGSPIHALGPVTQAGTITNLSSMIWSGYADPGAAGAFTRVTGSWVVPTATCTSATSAAVFWVGLDGLSDSTLEQSGTLVECTSGSPSYFDWWEIYPSTGIQAVHPVRRGDHIVSTVTFSNGRYVMSVKDTTTPADSFTITRACGATPCRDTSAEWIAEAPSNGTGILPLTNFGHWALTGAHTTYRGSSRTITGPPQSDRITMFDTNSRIKAVPGAPNSTGTAFRVTWKRSN